MELKGTNLTFLRATADAHIDNMISVIVFISISQLGGVITP